MKEEESKRTILDEVTRMRDALPEVTALLRRILDGTEGQKLEGAQATARGLLDRAACWLQTLHALDRPQHFQAHAAGMRAMIELTADLGLLYDDPTRNERIEAWELSAKWKHAKLTCDYVRAGGTLGETRVALATKFLEDKRAEVEELRARLWNTKDHPDRWTQKPLVADVNALDARVPNLQLRQVYEEQYRFLCWSIHGSALAMTRTADGETILALIGMILCGAAMLGLAAAEFALRLLSQFGSNWQIQLQRAREDWHLRYGGLTRADLG